MLCTSSSLSALTVLALTSLAVLLLCAPAMAQVRPRAAMDADAAALVARIDAVRGAGALPKTLALEGTYEVFFAGAATEEPVARGAFREAFAGGDRARHTSEMGSFGAMERGLTPDLVWEVDPTMGAKRYDGAAARTVRRWFALLRGDSPAGLYTAIATRGTAEVAGVACTVLEMQPESGEPERWYVDPKTGHVRRVDMALPSPDSAGATFDMEETIDAKVLLGDWKKAGDAAYPHRRDLEMGPATVVMRIEQVRPGADIEPERFAPPEAVTKLQPKAEGRPVGHPEGPTYAIVEREAQPVASIRVQCKPAEISATLAVLLPEVMAHLTASGAKVAGAPFSRYHGFTADAVDLEAGIPVAEPIEEQGRVKNRELPAGKVVTTWHIGPYDQLSKAHQALQDHVRERELKPRGSVWEVYWTDPGMVPDSSKWRTQLFLPIEQH